MICPSCKGENPAHAVRCGDCGAVLEFPKAGKTLASDEPGALDKDKPKPTSGGRPPSRMDRQDDRTIDSVVPAKGSRTPEGPGVSILSKTPSGAIPLDD